MRGGRDIASRRRMTGHTYKALVADPTTNTVVGRNGLPLFRVISPGVFQGEEDTGRNLQSAVPTRLYTDFNRVALAGNGDTRLEKYLAPRVYDEPIPGISLVAFMDWALDRDSSDVLGVVGNALQSPVARFVQETTGRPCRSNPDSLDVGPDRIGKPYWAAHVEEALWINRVHTAKASDVYKALGVAVSFHPDNHHGIA